MVFDVEVWCIFEENIKNKDKLSIIGAYVQKYNK